MRLGAGTRLAKFLGGTYPRMLDGRFRDNTTAGRLTDFGAQSCSARLFRERSRSSEPMAEFSLFAAKLRKKLFVKWLKQWGACCHAPRDDLIVRNRVVQNWRRMPARPPAPSMLPVPFLSLNERM